MGGASLLLLGGSLIMLGLAGIQPKGSARSLIMTITAALLMVAAIATGITSMAGR